MDEVAGLGAPNPLNAPKPEPLVDEIFENGELNVEAPALGVVVVVVAAVLSPSVVALGGGLPNANPTGLPNVPPLLTVPKPEKGEEGSALLAVVVVVVAAAVVGAVEVEAGVEPKTLLLLPLLPNGLGLREDANGFEVADKEVSNKFVVVVLILESLSLSLSVSNGLEEDPTLPNFPNGDENDDVIPSSAFPCFAVPKEPNGLDDPNDDEGVPPASVKVVDDFDEKKSGTEEDETNGDLARLAGGADVEYATSILGGSMECCVVVLVLVDGLPIPPNIDVAEGLLDEVVPNPLNLPNEEDPFPLSPAFPFSPLSLSTPIFSSNSFCTDILKFL